MAATRQRRVQGWGWADESLAVPAPLRRWLASRLGPPEERRAVDLEEIEPPAPRPLPPLPSLSQTPEDRLRHARGQGLPDLIRLRSGRLPHFPDGVVRPGTAEEVAAVLSTCSAAGVRVIPWGGGTSVTGGVNTPAGPEPVVVLDLERLSGLRRLDPLSGLAAFGAGTTGPGLEAALAHEGWTLGHFPQSFELSTLGGWVATRSAGQESLGYGRIEDLTAGLTLVAPGGRLELPAFPASAAGPDLRHLALGSEGRLGVITEVIVRCRPRPDVRRARAWLLPSWESGVEAVRSLTLAGPPLTLLRLSNPPETRVAMSIGLGRRAWAPLARGWLRLKGAGAPSCLLLAGAAGAEKTVGRALDATARRLKRRGAVSLGERPGKKWLADRFRHPYLRDALLDLGYATETLETAAPWAALPALYDAVGQALATGLTAEEAGEVPVLCHLSHPYRDGASLYFTFFFRDREDPQQSLARWARLKRAATAAVVDAGGTLSHHHGIGAWHAPWYRREAGDAGARVLVAAVRELDPQGILNPHVLFDPEDRLED